MAFSQENVKTIRLGFIGVGGRGTGLLKVALVIKGVEAPAICDISEPNLTRALDLVEKARGKKPEGYSKGPTDYRRMLARDDLDAVLIATPMQLHSQMAADSLRAGKNVLSEVAAAITLDGCWEIVKAAQESKKVYMLAENVCYYPSNLSILEMVKKGLFGDLTYAECGYVHDCRGLLFKGDGSLTCARRTGARHEGNWYPTHSLGPVAQWLGINRGDRLVSSSPPAAARRPTSFTAQRFGKERYAGTRSAATATTRCIRTAGARSLTCASTSLPSGQSRARHLFTLQGTTASYDDRDAEQEDLCRRAVQAARLDPFFQLRKG